MEPQQLKGKVCVVCPEHGDGAALYYAKNHARVGNVPAFSETDVKAAVEWLKATIGEIRKDMPPEPIMNTERVNIQVAYGRVLKVIDLAFPDVVE